MHQEIPGLQSSKAILEFSSNRSHHTNSAKSRKIRQCSFTAALFFSEWQFHYSFTAFAANKRHWYLVWFSPLFFSTMSFRLKIKNKMVVALQFHCICCQQDTLIPCMVLSRHILLNNAFFQYWIFFRTTNHSVQPWFS